MERKGGRAMERSRGQGSGRGRGQGNGEEEEKESKAGSALSERANCSVFQSVKPGEVRQGRQQQTGEHLDRACLRPWMILMRALKWRHGRPLRNGKEDPALHFHFTRLSSEEERATGLLGRCGVVKR